MYGSIFKYLQINCTLCGLSVETCRWFIDQIEDTTMEEFYFSSITLLSSADESIP